jgi:hypothetical protein
MDSSMNLVANASTVTATGGKFENLDTVSSSSNTISTDATKTYYIVADILASTDATGVQINVSVA